jgi:hypothetical protein
MIAVGTQLKIKMVAPTPTDISQPKGKPAPRSAKSFLPAAIMSGDRNPWESAWTVRFSFHPIVGMTNTASDRAPLGQRVVMVLSRV